MATPNEQIMTGSLEEREKALKILGRSIFRELKAQGYPSKQIIGLATELISLVTVDLHDASDSQRR